MNTEKTIKQLADELGVTKDKVKYQARKLPKELTSKKDGITYLNNEAIFIIKDNILGNKKKVTNFKNNENLPNYYLVEQLKLKDKEISEKNTQITMLLNSTDKLQKLLDQQQILTLQANKKIKELEHQNEENLSSKKKDRFSFFTRFFRK